MGFLDEKFYTDVITGKKISLRNASQIGVNTHFDNNALSVYDKTTNTHHQISDSFETEDEALEYMENFNKRVHDEIVVSTATKSSPREQERWEARKAEIEREQGNG